MQTLRNQVDGGISLPLREPDYLDYYPGFSRMWARALPLRPIWPGFAINTISYVAILWLLFAFPGALRRFIRRKRGYCTRCGYDLRINPGRCPECGRPCIAGTGRYCSFLAYVVPAGTTVYAHVIDFGDNTAAAAYSLHISFP